ncbi:MAG: hypothetical protein V3V75_06335 [Thermoguttaceae bacterium]
MAKSLSKTAFSLALALLVGCASPPGPANRPGISPAQPAGVQPVGVQPHGGAQAAPGPPMPAPPVPGNGSQAAAMQGVISELGALDRESQDRLMSDLQRTDPALWPAIMQQFRAAAAYRNRAQALQAATSGPVEARPAAPLAQQFVPPGEVPPSVDLQPRGVNRLPAANSHLEAPNSAPQDNYPQTGRAPIDPRVVKREPSGGAHRGAVVGASFEASGNPDWQTQLRNTISALESQVADTPQTPEEVAQHARLRMLYMLAGRRDEAARPIQALPPAMQDFWSKQAFGMATLLDTQRTGDATSRTAETKWILDEALTRLAESAPLVVRNLAFCTAVQSYGCTSEFKKYEFDPGQKVLLYAEIENFTSVATPKGYHTSLRSSYQIFDSRAQRVADHDFTTTEEYCDNARRDFFICYQLSLPTRIYPGKHTLKLTVEDLKGQKIGQTSIEFTVK